MRDTIAGSTGIAVIIAATLVSCLAMSVVTGAWFQWVLCGLGIFVGLQAAKIINRT